MSYELGLNGEKKVNGNWNITKNGHCEDDKFHISKPGNFSNLREGSFYCDTVTLKMIEEEIQCRKSVVVIFHIV